jgi:hypothetical protein
MKLAINRTVVGKPKTADQNKRMTFSYENVDVSLEKFASFVDAGYAFCAQHKDKRRTSGNFICSDFVAVDIDSSLRLEDALANPFIGQYASLIYTTESHTEEAHRFRIVFQTDQTITSAKEMKHAYTGAIVKLGGDQSCTDACRQFYGSSRPNTQLLGNSLPKHALDELIRLGAESTRRIETAGDQSGARASIVSEVTLDLDTAVTVSDGSVHRLADLPERTAIFCPKHVDNKPSAFTLRSKNGVVGIHCSACKRTYFTSAYMPLYDFNYALTNLDPLAKQVTVIEEHEFVALEYKRDEGVIRLDEKYLPTLQHDTPFVLVRSPKGTGKTKRLEDIVARCKRERGSSDGWRVEKGKPRKKSVLLIGHRQTLIQSVARRLGLVAYFFIWEQERNGKTLERKATNPPTPYYAVCADSLCTLLEPMVHKYEVVLIDEVEQVISHLTSNTLRDRRIETFLFFKHYINRAREVYVLDADLNQLTVETLYALTSDKTKQVMFITNDYRVEDRELYLYENKSHLTNDLIQAIGQGQRCFVVSNSKKFVESLAEVLKETFGDERRILSITSDNSQDSAIQEFLENI